MVKIFPHFIQLGSLPCSQNPTTGTYSEPDESSPYLHTLFI